MRIIEASPTDSDAMLSIERAAFARDDEAELVAALLQDPTAQSSLSLLSFVANKPVGHVLFTKVALAGASGNVRAAILAPLAVLPEFQPQGVDRDLIERGASMLAASGVQLLFVLGEPSYYTQFGFVPAIPYGLRAPYPISPGSVDGSPTGARPAGHGHWRHHLRGMLGKARVLARVDATLSGNS